PAGVVALAGIRFQGRTTHNSGLTARRCFMAARSVWKGHIRFSLVTIPVKAYTATASGGGRIHLNQLHARGPDGEECGSRIRYMKYCPVHGEVASSEIISGYQVDKDRYVVIDTDEVEKLRKP